VEGIVAGNDINVVQTRPQQGSAAWPASIKQRM